MLTVDIVISSTLRWLMLFRQQGFVSAEQRSLATAEQSHCSRWMPVRPTMLTVDMVVLVRYDGECCLDSKVLFQLSNEVSPQQSSLTAADGCQYRRGCRQTMLTVDMVVLVRYDG
jgi:hypothetical protein